MINASNIGEQTGPKISVITACFNSEATVGDTVSSVNDQSYSNVEHVFIDGASTDKTVEVISECSRRDNLLLSEPDKGIYDALNKGIALATGDVIGFLHADDFFAHPGVLEKIGERFSESGLGGVYGDLQYVSQADSGKVVRHWQTGTFSTARLRRGWMPPHPTLYIRKQWYELVGDFDTKYCIAADYFSILRLFGSPDFHSAYIPDVLVKMRVGGASNRSLKNIIQKSCEDLDALRRSGVGGFGTVLAKNFRKVKQFI